MLCVTDHIRDWVTLELAALRFRFKAQQTLRGQARDICANRRRSVGCDGCTVGFTVGRDGIQHRLRMPIRAKMTENDAPHLPKATRCAYGRTVSTEAHRPHSKRGCCPLRALASWVRIGLAQASPYAPLRPTGGRVWWRCRRCDYRMLVVVAYKEGRRSASQWPNEAATKNRKLVRQSKQPESGRHAPKRGEPHGLDASGLTVGRPQRSLGQVSHLSPSLDLRDGHLPLSPIAKTSPVAAPPTTRAFHRHNLSQFVKSVWGAAATRRNDTHKMRS